MQLFTFTYKRNATLHFTELCLLLQSKIPCLFVLKKIIVLISKRQVQNVDCADLTHVEFFCLPRNNPWHHTCAVWAALCSTRCPGGSGGAARPSRDGGVGRSRAGAEQGTRAGGSTLVEKLPGKKSRSGPSLLFIFFFFFPEQKLFQKK